MRKAIFLDRDGTLIVEKRYAYKIKDLEWIPRTAEAIKILKEKDYLVIVVSNQSGIGRGYYTEADAERLHAEMDRQLMERGAGIDAFYYCPHRPEEGCPCRKPGTALFWRAQRDHGIDFRQSYVIGDKLSDMQAAKELGLRAALVLTGYGAEEVKRYPVSGRVYADLYQFACSIPWE